MTQVRICCGVGGVGKTTTAAALGVGHALAGQRVVVLTIDPARRLADALGLPHLGNTPTEIPVPGASGRLDALMLDRKATWDEVIRRYAPDEATAARLLDNRYYRALSERLTGGHEYMATEKLHTLVEDGRWDVVVVDTPPSQHALDFFRAPERIRRILDQRVLGALLEPSTGLLGLATGRIIKQIRRLAGESVMDDLAEFFDLVGHLSSGFRERGAKVHDLLRSDRCHYLVVADARGPREDDLLDFVHTLRDDGMDLTGVILNRVEPRLPHSPAVLDPDAVPAPEGADAEEWSEALQALTDEAYRRTRTAEAHQRLAQRLRSAAEAQVWTLTHLPDGVLDLDGLLSLAQALPPLHDPELSLPGA